MVDYMSESDWTTHIVAGAAWRRFGIMLLFIPILGCVGCFIAFTAVFQFLSVLANGETSPNLRSSGKDLSRYATTIIDFLTYNSEHRPFPFAAPGAGESSSATSGAATAQTPRPRSAPSSGKKTATRKASQRKRTSTKKTTRRTTSTSKKTGTTPTRQTTTPPDKTSD